MGFLVIYNNNKVYTYNRALAVKLASKYKGIIKKVSENEIKKALDKL